MSKLFGYARVSTTDQDLTVQVEALKAAGVNEALIFAEKASGTKMDGRVELQRVLALLSQGDCLVVMRLDRLARNMKDYCEIIETLKRLGAGIKCTHEPIDASGPMGMLVMDILMAVASFETRRRKERQEEGIERVKSNGEVSEKTGMYKYSGRPPKLDPAVVKRLMDEGKGPSEIKKILGCSRQSVYRLLNDA